MIRAYEEQFEAVEAAGSPIILMASRALVRVARSADDYLKVYDRLLAQAREPVIIHWLGDMFDPQLAGYWGSSGHSATAMATALDAIRAHPDKVDGIKISLLDAAWEIEMRRRLPPGVRMYTRRRLQLRGADRRRRAGPFRCAARHLRRDRAGRLGGA